MTQLPDEDDTPFSLPRDVPEKMPIDYPQTDSNIDLHEAYDEGIDDSVEADPYRPDDSPVEAVKKSMKAGVGGKGKVTTDRGVIRRWVEEREGQPARQQGTEDGLDISELRISFQDGEHDAETETISWKTFFDIFELEQLALLYKDKTDSGAESTYFKFVPRGPGT